MFFNSLPDSSIDAPPSLKPPKKYADLSGFVVSGCKVNSLSIIIWFLVAVYAPPRQIGFAYV